MGPLLYIINTNEIADITDEHLILYADDTSDIMSEDCCKEATDRMCESMRMPNEWFQVNNILLSDSRVMMVYRYSNNLSKFKID